MDLDYKKFRWFKTSSGKIVIGGKNEDQNEAIVKEFIGKNNIIIHTEEPGSPFCIIMNEKASREDIEEASIFTASFSQQWKKKKSKAQVNIFSGKDVHKEKSMKTGTFGVNNSKRKNVELKLKIAVQDEKIRAIPLNAESEINLPEIILSPGMIPKAEVSKLIKQNLKNYNFSLEDIEQAIPSGGFNIRKI
ncbi:MAG: NFACT RNA binding domain-containing protein [Nanoarchaeota archaeon]